MLSTATLVALFLAQACPKVTIPVHFHVVYADASANVSETRIAEQLYVLNDAFAAGGIGFSLGSIDRVGNKGWSAAGPNSAALVEMTNALSKNPATSVNVYIAELEGDYLEFATAPSSIAPDSKQNGVFVYHGSLPYGYGEGDRLVVGMARYFGLLNTFGATCSDHGDGVADTAVSLASDGGCAATVDTCPGGAADPLGNYMSGQSDECVYYFTSGQLERMNEVARSAHPGLFASAPSLTDCCPTDSQKRFPGVCGCNVAELPEDSDFDNAPDCLDSCPYDEWDDYDKDGVCADVEARRGSDPEDSDTDDDGLSDGDEIARAGSGACPSPVNPDSDNDGKPDGSEVAAGADPCAATYPAPPSPEPHCGGCSDDDPSLMAFGLVMTWRFRRRKISA